MEFIHPAISQMINTKNETQKPPEEKEDADLEIADRLYLVSKSLEDSFLIHTFLDILQHHHISISFDKSMMNEYVIEDIELLADHFQNEEKGIFSKINHTHTKMGELILKKILVNPIYDIELLKRRQKMIMDIGRVSHLISPKLKEIRHIENELIWFWNDQHMRHLDLMNDLIYFNYDFIPFFDLNDILNRNEKALMITNMYKIIVSPLMVALTPIVSFLVPLIIFMIQQRRMGLQMSFYELFTMYLKVIYQFNPIEIFTKPSTQTYLASFMSKAFYLFMYLQNVYYSYQSSKNTHQMINVIHEKLNKMAKYIQLSEEIQEICEKAGMKRLDTFVERDDEIKENLQFTKKHFGDSQNPNQISTTFHHDPSLFSHKGVILKAFQQFRKHKEKMHESFQYIAYIDAIQSIHQLHIQSTKENPYCMTEYQEDRKKPSVWMREIWHPYLNQSVTKHAVKNDLHMKNNILITGPNAGGKSTFIKSVVVNILFSQTICVASAESFKMTPFRMIETYLHIPDSKGSQSLFEAEMYRSRDYLERLKELGEKDFSFIVLDEIFSSTNYIEGFSGAYAILKKISTFDNTLSMTTTHYSDLEKLEKDTKGRFENYKFEVTYDELKNITFHYQLVRGTSRQYIALDLLERNGFDKDIIQDAIHMSKQIVITNGKKKRSKIVKKEKESK